MQAISEGERPWNMEWWDFPDGPVIDTSSPNAVFVGLIPGWGAEIPCASGPKNQNIKQKQYCNKFNKDFVKVHLKKKKHKTQFPAALWV